MLVRSPGARGVASPTSASRLEQRARFGFDLRHEALAVRRGIIELASLQLHAFTWRRIVLWRI